MTFNFRKLAPGFTLAIIFIFNAVAYAQQTGATYHVVGYVGGFGRPISVDGIEAKKLTHVNYSFANVKDTLAVFDNIVNDTANLRKLTDLRKVNPKLAVLISIGGGSRSRFFSDAVLTPSSRAKFTKSCLDMMKDYDLDGLDVDWEYPGQRGGNNNVFREPEDKTNFTLMWIDLRKALDDLAKQTGRKYWLTGAFNVSKAYTDRVELAEVAKYMDFINLMTYDFSGPNNTVGHHTNLYNYGTLGPRSADKGIQDYIKMGVPPEKILIGVAFYSHTRRAATTNNNGLGEPRAQLAQGETLPSYGGYSSIRDSLVNKQGFKRYWDKEAQAPFLFNAQSRDFITYDDEKSTRLKARYAKKYKLGGAFFWQYYSDPKGYLLKVLDKELSR